MFYIRDDFEGYGEKELERDMKLLPKWRREQAEKFRFFQGKRDCTVSYLMLCEALEKEYGIKDKPTFLIGEHGKPTLKEYPEVHFNLSHCREAIACIVDTRPVGIDVESIGRYRDTVANYAMNESELKLIHESPQPELTFTELWTRKEALLKCLGTGITDDLKNALADCPSGISIETLHYPEKNYIISMSISENAYPLLGEKAWKAVHPKGS